MLRRSRMLALVLLTLLPAVALAACGGDGSGSDSGSGDGRGGGTTMTTGTGASAEATTATNGRRTVEHAMGTTEIDGTPRRVVVLGDAELELATALGVRPAGTVRPGARVSKVVAEQARDIPLVGTSATPDLDAIASLRPDLILGSAPDQKRLYEQLAAIAPTVFTARPAAWRRNVVVQATALGKLPQAQELLDDWERRARG